MTVVFTLTGPNPHLPGRPHHPGRLRGGPGHDRPGHGQPQRPADPGGHRALHLLPVAAQRPLHRHPQPELLAQRAPLPRLDHLQAHPRHHPARIDPPHRWRRHDRVRRPHHHHQLLRVGRRWLPIGRHPDRGHRPADVLLHHAERRGRSHQRPLHPPGPGHGHEPGQRCRRSSEDRPPNRPPGSSSPVRPTTARPTTRPTTRRRQPNWSTSTRPSTVRRPSICSPSPNHWRSRSYRPFSRCGSRWAST